MIKINWKQKILFLIISICASALYLNYVEARLNKNINDVTVGGNNTFTGTNTFKLWQGK